MPDKEARENLVPITFKEPLPWKKQMEAICAEYGHKTISETYRAAVRLYMDDYHRSKAA